MKQNKKSTQVKLDKFNNAKIDKTTSVAGGTSGVVTKGPYVHTDD